MDLEMMIRLMMAENPEAMAMLASVLRAGASAGDVLAAMDAVAGEAAAPTVRVVGTVEVRHRGQGRSWTTDEPITLSEPLASIVVSALGSARRGDA